jgi:uncharacterized membrane protein
MNERGLRAATFVVGCAGMAIAAYLSYTRLTDVSIICPTSGCATVQRSEYSELAGVPVAHLGVVAYAAIAATALAAGRRASAAGVLLALAAAGFALYLLVAQLTLIHAVCIWCLGSDAVAFTLVVLTVWRLRTPPRRPRLGDVFEAV